MNSVLRARSSRYLVWLVVLLGSGVHCAAPAPQVQPNVVIIYADDWGYGDFSAHGHPDLKTPNLDRLIEEGTDFSLFTVSSPTCSPSRAGLMTGKFPARFNIHGPFASVDANSLRGMPDWLDPETVLMQRLFQQAGYKTGHFGKWHLTDARVPDAPPVGAYGYDSWEVFNHRKSNTTSDHHITAEAAVEFIRSNQSQPFFLNLWLHETHVPHYIRPGFLERFEHLEEQNQVYPAVVADGDAKVGDVLAILDELKLTKQTLVIFASDNGPEKTRRETYKAYRGGFGLYYSMGDTAGRRGSKNSLFNGGIGAPFIVRWPGHVPAGAKDDLHQVTGVDLLPTLCEAAGIPLPEGYASDGESRLPVLLGRKEKRSKAIFWEWRGTAPSKNQWPRHAVVEDGWKLLTNDKGNNHLYQVIDDPQERINLAAEHPERVTALLDRISSWRAELPSVPDSKATSKRRNTEGEKKSAIPSDDDSLPAGTS